MELVLIAAVSDNNVIGLDGQVPWHIAEDMKRFKELTLHHPVIMGRKTYESIPLTFRPLSQRQNIVLSTQLDYHPPGVLVMSSLEEAFDVVRRGEPAMNGIDYTAAFVIGGESVYRKAMTLADRMEITQVHQNVDGDAYFPAIDHTIWKEKKREDHNGYSFVTYTKRVKCSNISPFGIYQNA